MKDIKQILLIITSLLLVFGAGAQPTITRFMNFELGDKFWMKPAGLSINTSMITQGPNQVWDFSNLPTNQESIGSVCVTPASTPYADSAEVKNSNMAIEPLEWDNDTILLYQFFRQSNTQSETMALGMYHNYDKVSASYTKWLDPFISMKTPMTYGNSYNDRHILKMYNIAQQEPILIDTSNITVSVVGYGTVKTPAGTFENALLFKETVNWIWWNNYGMEIYKTQGTDINYQWRVPGIKLGVLSVCIANGAGGNVSYLDRTEFKSGGINNPDDSGNGNGGGGNGNGSNEPYDPSGVWLNAISGGGDYFAQSNGSLSWTMGETVTETMQVNPTLTQGFNQPYDIPTAIFDEEIKAEIKVYPNPFISELSIDFPSFKKAVDAAIYTNTGQIVKTFSLEEPHTRLQLNDYKSGIYYIRLMAKDGSRSFVVVKK